MDEFGFRTWLIQNEVTKKVQGDCISRLKRIEHEINLCDIDDDYENDGCKYLMSLFLNMGNNEEMRKFPNANFPIGKYYMSTYRRALKQYIDFKKSM